MFEEKVPIHENDWLYWMNVDAVPFDQRGHRFWPVKNDRLWNMNALTLLQRAGLIRLHEPLDVERPDNGSWVGVEVLDPRIFTDEWRLAWQEVRARARAARDEELTYLRELVSTSRPTEHVLRDALTIDVRGVTVRANETCGGCPACRRAGFKARCESVAFAGCGARGGRVRPRSPDPNSLRAAFATRPTRAERPRGSRGVRPQKPRSRRRRLAVAGRLDEFGLDEDLLAQRFVFVEPEIPETRWAAWSGCVELIVVSNGSQVLPPWSVEAPADAVRMVVFPEDLPDPDRPDRLLSEMRDSWPLGSVATAMRSWLF